MPMIEMPGTREVDGVPEVLLYQRKGLPEWVDVLEGIRRIEAEPGRWSRLPFSAEDAERPDHG